MILKKRKLNKKISKIFLGFFCLYGIVDKIIFKKTIMQKYKTFIIFIILTAIWSSLFSIMKYFFW
jgi:hypothetical protein